MIPAIPNLQHILSQHKNKPIQDVGLALSHFPQKERSFILNQLYGLKKAGNKLPSWTKEDIYFPPSLNLEQCSSEIAALAKIDLLIGKSLLDLTGGFGVDSTIFAQHGMSIQHVEPAADLQELVKHNVEVFGLTDQFTFHNTTAEHFLSINQHKVDSIYIDPSRRDERQIKLVSLADCTPNIVELLPKMKAIAQRIIVKLSPMFDIHQLIKHFPDSFLIRIVAIKNDCKELIIVFDSTQKNATPIIQTRNYLSNIAFQEFETNFNTNSSSSHSKVLNFLYDPNTAIHKAQLYAAIEQAFDIKPISSQTHLFTSDRFIPSFPGRICKVIKQLPYKKGNLTDPVMIVPRNFPDKEELIRKKMKLKHGENYFLYAFRDDMNKPQLVFGEKM